MYTTDLKLLRNNQNIVQVLQRRNQDQEIEMFPSLTFILMFTNSSAAAISGPVLTDVGRSLLTKAIASAFLLPEPGDCQLEHDLVF